MQLSNTSRADLLLARTSEFFQSWAPWQRRVWDVGTVLALREAHEATEWVQRKVLSAGALTWCLRESLRPRIGQDLALGEGAIRQQLNTILTSDLRAGSHNHRALGHLIEHIESGYLRRWRDAVVSDISKVHVERTARHVACHMLDLGFDLDFMRHESKKVLDESTDLGEYFEFLIALEQQGLKKFTGVVAFETMPEIGIAKQAKTWVSPEEVSRLLDEKFPDRSNLRYVGGLRFSVTAREPKSAVREIGYILDRLGNRTRYLRNQSVPWQPHPWVFFDTEPSPLSIETLDLRVDILSLQKTGALYEVNEGRGVSQIDEALELAASLNAAAPSVAVAGGWASLESLLVSPQDGEDREVGKSVAADRAAWLVTASWPRAELTTLSHNLRNPPDRLARALAAEESNIKRCRILSNWISTGQRFSVAGIENSVAMERMIELHSNPRPTLGRVNGYMRGTMRRLYRQRNIVLHGGSTQSVALRATLRTAAPLVGAVLDRITHGFIVGHQDPLESASRAQVAISVVHDPHAWRLYDLTSDASAGLV